MSQKSTPREGEMDAERDGRPARGGDPETPKHRTGQNRATSPGTMLPELDKREREEARRRSTITALVVHEAVREEGERELDRHPVTLAWSGLAAGLSMGFSMVGQGLLLAHLPDASWRPLIVSFGYTFGFLIVVLGRQQLFTENTLTAILPLLAHPGRRTLLRVAQLWGIVLATNLLGALIFASVAAHTPIFAPEVQAAFARIGHDAIRGDFVTTLLRAIMAGWLIALMVWLQPAADTARLQVIILITYLVGIGGFAHIIASSVEVMYLASVGTISWLTYFGGFLVPTLIGNIIGGVVLVAVLNYAQVATEGQPLHI
ncbi:MAG: formate/nitrite transporter family protein [Ktedonobacterales bacterium]